MQRLLILLLSAVLSAVGWKLGAYIGIGTAWLVSSIGLLAGVYLGWRVGQRFLK